MCGITGFIDLTQSKNESELTALVTTMSDTLRHRGPDSGGVWVQQETGVALGHRRLAILDLTEAGHQPMHSSTDRYAISFNGEIYNFLSIKARLEKKGYKFRGHSDTETLLAAIEEWGLKKALSEINGMFAFALWDKKHRTLSLARDRMGKKPLYYARFGDVFLFGSELKSLRAHPDFVPEIDRNALTAYTRHNYVPAPWSIYKGVYKLPPASFVSIAYGEVGEINPELYWDIKSVAEHGCNNPIDAPFEKAVDEFDAVLGQAVSERMISDVPLGSFLSGGIDSSLITALMQKNSANPVKTFCIGFEENGYNEAPYAEAVAEHLGTDHTEYFVTAAEAREVIPDIPKIFDEPFADPSQIPTYIVSKLARQDVTVALSGDGGDEGFAGYQRYHRAQKAVDTIGRIPKIARSSLAALLSPLPLTGKAEKLHTYLRHMDENQLYRSIQSYWENPEDLVIGGQEPQIAMNDHSRLSNLDNIMDRMMFMDMNAYLPDDILVKVDRASMAASLETRAPLLDYKVIEYAWRTPLSMKIDDKGGKRMLRSLLGRYVPTELFDRPKQGFGIPHGEWIKHELKDWAEDLLDEKRLKDEGFFNVALVRSRWEEHIAGKKDWSYALWGILMFQAWHGYNEHSR